MDKYETGFKKYELFVTPGVHPKWPLLKAFNPTTYLDRASKSFHR